MFYDKNIFSKMGEIEIENLRESLFYTTKN